MSQPYDIVILGLSITSSWGNGHATTYRSLVRGLAARGHQILFLEGDMPWYAGNRDEPHPPGARTEIYRNFGDLVARFEREVTQARLVIVGSFVPAGARVGDWVLSVAKGIPAFYDIDTPVTLSKLAEGSWEYLTPEQVARYRLYLSFTGGPLLRTIESRYGSPIARPLYCSVDTKQYRPVGGECRWDLGYLGTYSDDRQPALETLLLEPARQWKRGRFTVAGPMYPKSILWPANVQREIHLSPRDHPGFYNAQRFTLNITREAMKSAGYSPSVRLFEAGACATAVISDWWEGLDTIFEPGRDVLVASDCEDTLRFLKDTSGAKLRSLGEAARRRVLAEHTPAHRAMQLECYWKEADDNFSAHSSRRHRRHREGDGRMGAGMAPQRARQTAGGHAGPTAGEHRDQGGLHQPAGAGN
ncbi:MAG: glycosyltransferase [Terriglobia bacterium]|nr:MAG: glycosyltransferase [Terriglobia bacterium]